MSATNKERGSYSMPKYRFYVEKSYEVTAPTKEEALALINSEQEYNYLVDESWQVEGESDV